MTESPRFYVSMFRQPLLAAVSAIPVVSKCFWSLCSCHCKSIVKLLYRCVTSEQKMQDVILICNDAVISWSLQRPVVIALITKRAFSRRPKVCLSTCSEAGPQVNKFEQVQAGQGWGWGGPQVKKLEQSWGVSCELTQGTPLPHGQTDRQTLLKSTQ